MNKKTKVVTALEPIEINHTEEKKLSSIVHPLVQIDGAPTHPLVEMFDRDPEKIPKIKSIGHIRVPHKNTYMSLVIITQGDKVLSIEVGEPNLKAITIDETKINFVTAFIDEDEYEF